MNVETSVIVNPDVYWRTVGLHAEILKPIKRNTAYSRPIICTNCLTGSHHLCDCKACACQGEFRER